MSLLSMLDQVKHAVASPFESKPKAQAQAQANGVKAMASTGTGSAGTAADPTNQATITANDFLTLLVTEIQNQDPTTQTDPMQYITQLVGVNSLEQLVQINQTLSATPGTTTPTGSAASSSSAATPAAAAKAASASTATAAATQTAAHLLPLGSNVQLPASSETAVAQAFTHASTLPTQAIAPTQIPLDPAVMRALQHSIPGATVTGSPSLPAAIAPQAGAAVR